MTQREGPGGETAGGETSRPTDRRLERAPGERYAASDRRARTRTTTDRTTSDDRAPRPRIGTAVLYGTAAVVGVASVWALATGVLDVSWGLVILAAAGGWLVGTAVGLGAWRGIEHPPDRKVQAIALAEGPLAWLVGTFGGYLVGLLLLPGSSASLAERMANAPFVDALAAQFSLVDVASILLLAAIGWKSAR